jgi:hypothetical protein
MIVVGSLVVLAWLSENLIFVNKYSTDKLRWYHY